MKRVLPRTIFSRGRCRPTRQFNSKSARDIEKVLHVSGIAHEWRAVLGNGDMSARTKGYFGDLLALTLVSCPFTATGLLLT